MKPPRVLGIGLTLLGLVALVASFVSYSPPQALRPVPEILAFIGPFLLLVAIAALPSGWRLLRDPDRATRPLWPPERSEAAKASAGINYFGAGALIAGIVILAGHSRLYDPSYRQTLAFLTMIVGATIPFLGRWLIKASVPDRPTP